MKENNNSRDGELTSLWEQMGTSTGSFLGRTIGQSAEYGLETYRQLIINPLSQLREGPPGIRQQTWEEMGRAYGETVGQSVGMAMDLLIDSLKGAASAVPSDTVSTASSGTAPQNPSPEHRKQHDS